MKSAYHEAYYKLNKDKIRRQQKAYYEHNKDKIRLRTHEYHREYYQGNKDRLKASSKQRYWARKEGAIAESGQLTLFAGGAA